MTLNLSANIIKAVVLPWFAVELGNRSTVMTAMWRLFHFSRKNRAYDKREEMVRSKSEVLLADMFYDLGIPYRYECELNLKNGKRLFPDFTLLKKSTREEIYHEHLGMMDEEEYLNHNLYKIEEYRKNGIYLGKNLILTFESASCPLNIGEIRKSMKELFL